MIRSFLIYPPLAIAHVGMNLFVWLTAWFWALLSVVFGWDRLPGILFNLQTLDNPLDTWVNKTYQTPTILQRWWGRTYWLFRNPAQVFNIRYLSLPVNGTDVTVYSNLPSQRWDLGTRFKYIKAELVYDGKSYFEFRADVPIGFGLFIKMWFGWMSKSYDGETYMLRLEFQPRKVIRGTP